MAHRVTQFNALFDESTARRHVGVVGRSLIVCMSPAVFVRIRGPHAVNMDHSAQLTYLLHCSCRTLTDAIHGCAQAVQGSLWMYALHVHTLFRAICDVPFLDALYFGQRTQPSRQVMPLQNMAIDNTLYLIISSFYASGPESQLTKSLPQFSNEGQRLSPLHLVEDLNCLRYTRMQATASHVTSPHDTNYSITALIISVTMRLLIISDSIMGCLWLTV